MRGESALGNTTSMRRGAVVRERCRRVRALAALTALVTAVALPVAAHVAGDALRYTSPNDITERCVMLTHMPGGVYSERDAAQERALCAVDFYDNAHALCPKVFSTSPGTLVYDISRGEFAGRPQQFEDAQCAHVSPVKRGAVGEPIMFKMTMNDRRTSATFATSALLYYHFSRYLAASVHVPVSVFRAMDKDVHRARVSQRGIALSAHRKGGAMNHAGWEILVAAERNPSSYPATDELFTADRSQVHGVLLQPHGDRYGPEFNGTRRSGWGAGQNRDFQETAPFLALRSALPLVEAIDHGIHVAADDTMLRQAMRHGVSHEQMVFWMQELTEITLLDYIFSQQDRIGNIDQLAWWYWVDDGTVRRQPSSGTAVPAAIAAHHPLRIKRTELNDNDAGGRVPYANFTKTTDMLGKIRHYRAETYRRLLRLAKDFDTRGPLYDYVRDTFGLSARQFGQLVDNTPKATSLLRESCHKGRLVFDLDPHAFLVRGEATVESIDCDEP